MSGYITNLFLSFFGCRYIMCLFFMILMFQNIELLRMVRFGPFAAFDLLFTMNVSRHLVNWSHTKLNIHSLSYWDCFFILFALGQILHILFSQSTPFLHLLCFISHSPEYHNLPLFSHYHCLG